MLIQRHRDSDVFGSTDFDASNISFRAFKTRVLGRVSLQVNCVTVPAVALGYDPCCAQVNVSPVRMSLQNLLNPRLFVLGEELLFVLFSLSVNIREDHLISLHKENHTSRSFLSPQ